MAAKPSAGSTRFDEAYFDRYYGDPSTRVQGAKEVAQVARAVTSLAAFWGLPLRSALDLGAGLGLWKRALARAAPKLHYRGVDVSETACARHGHEQHDIATFREDTRFDLVICQGVLQYLGDRDAARAIRNIGAMCGGLLYLEALTQKDVAEVVDHARTDTDVHLRPGAWYRKQLARDFVTLGCGLFYAKRGSGVFFELEAAP